MLIVAWVEKGPSRLNLIWCSESCALTPGPSCAVEPVKTTAQVRQWDKAEASVDLAVAIEAAVTCATCGLHIDDWGEEETLGVTG